MSQQPPKWALQFLRWYCREDYLDEIEGDLLELYELRERKSSKRARLNFVWDVTRSFRPSNTKNLTMNNWTMYQIKNYSRIYFRRFRKETQQYLINIFGLALGFSVLLFISMYAYDEYSIDAYHTKGKNIYRVIVKSTDPEKGVKIHTSTPNPLAEALVNEFPEIYAAAKLYYLGSCSLEKDGIKFSERDYVLADYEVFDILDFTVLYGDPLQDREDPFSIVLTESTAIRLFGKVDVAGETMKTDWLEAPVKVAAVIADMPQNSSYQFNVIFLSTFDNTLGEGFHRWLKRWDSNGGIVLALFEENASPTQVMVKMPAFEEKYLSKEEQVKFDFSFQSIRDIHLKSDEIEQGGNDPKLTVLSVKESYLTIVLAIGFLVMLIAAFNYINLSSVQALKRTHEAGVRKINGATIFQLRFQLFLENFWTLFISYIINLGLVVMLFGSFLKISGKRFTLQELFTLDLIMFQIVLFLTIWLLSSIIPALYYSKLSHSVVLVKNVFSGKGDILRKVFVTLQYGISLMLVVGSIILYQQLNFVQHTDLGFDNTNLITLDINSGKARRAFREIIHELEQHPNVKSATSSSRVPGEWKWNQEVKISEIKGENELTTVQYSVEDGWLDTYGIELTDGQNFSGIDHSDTLKIILNETAVAKLGLENPIGTTLWVEEDTISKMQIIGVVKDFHLESLHQPMSPVVLTSWNNPIIGLDYFTIKYNGDPSAVLTHIESVQTQFDPETPAEINFLDERWSRYYKSDQSRSNLILIATLISIVISIFGLFGLVSFSAERRTKEVGIRKVMGASIFNVIGLILKDYLILLGIALIVAAPVAYWGLSQWLDGFAYRINLSPLVFIIAFLGVAVISFVTVFGKVYRLAKSNPVNSLKYE